MSEKYVFRMKAGDLLNPIKARFLKRESRSAIDLTNLTVTFEMHQVNDDSTVTELVNAAATKTDATAGEAEYRWLSGDTDIPGTHLARFVLTDGSSQPETFPADGWIEVRIEDLP